MADQIRVRFAPSPTGYLHVGGARSALYNWLFARRHGGVFVLRIEDTDRERSTEASTGTILDGMRWLGLAWDEGPHFQSAGIERHAADARRLLAEGSAYRCFCTPAELETKREAAGVEYRYDQACRAVAPAESEARAAAGAPFTVRFKVPGGATAWTDQVYGPIRFENESIEDFIVLRTDGTPVYNMAVVSDDVQMRITHVVRGEEHVANTPKQILLYQALGRPVPVFAHLPLILGPDGKKLSKRRNAVAVGDYAEKGILPEALVNFLALLGWNPGDDRELMSVDEMVRLFSMERINRKGAVFDHEKLEWMNGQYMARRSAESLLPLFAPLLVKEGLMTEEETHARRDWLLALVDQLKVRSRTVLEMVPQARVFLSDELAYDPDAAAKVWKNPEESAVRLGVVREALEGLEPWDAAAVDGALRAAAERAGVGLGKVAQPLRLALTGSSASPGIDFVVAAMGRARVLRRIDAARAHLGAREASADNR